MSNRKYASTKTKATKIMVTVEENLHIAIFFNNRRVGVSPRVIRMLKTCARWEKNRVIVTAKFILFLVWFWGLIMGFSVWAQSK